MKKIELQGLSDFGTNAYLLISEQNNAVLIDAPYDDGEILSAIKENGITLKKLLLTHGHCDHIASAAKVVEYTGCEVYIHEEDIHKLTDNMGNLSKFFRLPPIDPIINAVAIKGGDIITLDELSFRVLHTPGHTSGSVCYIIGEEMYCGDTLFRGSVGRVDMPDGNSRVMLRTLRMLADFETDIDYTLYSGHGMSTTINRERALNPYMKEI